MKPVLQVSISGPPVTSFTALTNVWICFAFSHIALQPKEAKDLFSWWALRWKSSLKYLPIRKITNINKYMWKAQDSVKSFCQSCQNQKQVNFHSGQLFQYVSKCVKMGVTTSISLEWALLEYCNVCGLPRKEKAQLTLSLLDLLTNYVLVRRHPSQFWRYVCRPGETDCGR